MAARYVLGVPGKKGCSWRITDALRHHEWTCQLAVMTVMMVQGSLLVKAWDEWGSKFHYGPVGLKMNPCSKITTILLAWRYQSL